MVRTVRTARAWFAEAARCYLELHQGCAWCGGSYRVYERRRSGRTEYQCSFCDFLAVRHEATGHCEFICGEDRCEPAPKTMCAT